MPAVKARERATTEQTIVLFVSGIRDPPGWDRYACPLPRRPSITRTMERRIIKGRSKNHRVGPRALLRSGNLAAPSTLTMFVIANVWRGMYALYHYALLPITYLVTPYVSYIMPATSVEKLRDFSLARSPLMGLAGPLPCKMRGEGPAACTCARNTWRGDI